MDYDLDRYRGRAGYREPFERRRGYDSDYHIEENPYGQLSGYDEGAEPWGYDSDYNYDVNQYGQITGYRTPADRVREREIARFAERAPYLSARSGAWSVPGPYAGVGPRGYRRSDESICEEVCRRLTLHGGIDASDISVSVGNGEVTLEGTVDSRRTKRMAEDTADTVTGVRDVHNRLQIKRQER